MFSRFPRLDRDTSDDRRPAVSHHLGPAAGGHGEILAIRHASRQSGRRRHCGAHGLGQRHWEESAFPLRIGPVISGTAVYLTQFPDLTPPSFVQNVRYNKVLHEQLVFLTTTTTRVPTAVIMFVSNRSRRVFDELWCNMDSWRRRTLLACLQPAGHRG